ncbi:MAG: GHKL domain-containing protein [Elusimicrobia bacterium]|nr:GHKL domain-containing protein [Elusimicrobiota bacterium]
MRQVKIEAILVFLTGLTVIIGWIFDIGVLKSLHPSWVTMKANTALCFMLLSSALFLRSFTPLEISRPEAAVAVPKGQGGFLTGFTANPAAIKVKNTLALSAAAISAASLFQYLAGVNLGIDEFLFRDQVLIGTSHPGRMAPSTAVNFTLLGLALFFIDSARAKTKNLTEYFVIPAIIIAFIPFTGYVYGEPALYGIAKYTVMAFNTAAVFMILSFGILSVNTDGGIMKEISVDCAGARTARFLIPFLFFAPFAAGWLRMLGERRGLYSPGVSVTVMVLTIIIVSAAIVLFHAAQANRIDKQRIFAEKELKEKNQELDSFTYSVSHDLRIPLRAVDGFSRMLLEDHSQKLDGEGRELLNVVRENTRKMARLIDDLLDFSRMSRKELSKDKTDMEETARDVFEKLKSMEKERDMELKISGLKPACADGALLYQVFQNLISNAVKFSRNKPKTIIEIGCSEQDNEIIYFVKDNGAGFDMRYYGKLFNVFQRLHSEKEFEGTGIGLATVQKVIRRHNGRVWAESRLNEGSSFYFTLPKE